MTVSDARIMPADGMTYEVMKAMLTNAIDKVIPLRYPGADEGLTATIRGLDDQNGYLVAKFEISDETATALGLLPDTTHYSIEGNGETHGD